MYYPLRSTTLTRGLLKKEHRKNEGARKDHTVKSYIQTHWSQTIRENKEDQPVSGNERGALIGMLCPYSIPSAGHFDEMYYWDTYFTNKGLLCQYES